MTTIFSQSLSRIYLHHSTKRIHASQFTLDKIYAFLFHEVQINNFASTAFIGNSMPLLPVF